MSTHLSGFQFFLSFFASFHIGQISVIVLWTKVASALEGLKKMTNGPISTEFAK